MWTPWRLFQRIFPKAIDITSAFHLCSLLQRWLKWVKYVPREFSHNCINAIACKLMKILNVIVLAATDNFHFDVDCVHTASLIFLVHWVYNLNVTQASRRERTGSLKGKEIFMHQKARMLSIVQWTLEILRRLKLAPRKCGFEKGLVWRKKRRQASELNYLFICIQKRKESPAYRKK